MTKLTIKVVNNDNETLIVDWNDSDVKVKGGFYEKLAKNTNKDTIAPGDTASIVHTATFGPEVNRRYRVAVNNGDNDDMIYYPSRTTWTTDSTPTISIKV